IRRQFGAALEMLENAIAACPEDLWSDRSRQPEFWYVVFHTLFFLDLYLSGTREGFAPPQPFTMDELDPAALGPERPYSKMELQKYLAHGRSKLLAMLEDLTEEEGMRRAGFEWIDLSEAELLLYNMRHVQHHAAQLNLILRQSVNRAPHWVAAARD